MLKKKTNTKSKNVVETKRRTTMKQEKVVIYTQVTTQEQAKKGYSLEAQQENLRKYAKENNLEIIKEFSDIGSAPKTKRQSFQEMLKFLESSKECKCILVTKADKLSKDFETLSELQKKYSVVSADCGANDMFNQLQIMLAQHYSKQMSERIKAGIQKRKEKVE